jgi:purine nucleosidase
LNKSRVSRTPLIIDCDPGVDDAIALLLAFACPEALDIIAVTTVAGNVNAELTARNGRIVRQIAEREDVPVYKGAAGPLARKPVEADEFHGASGLGWLEVFEPAAPLAEGHSALAIVEAVMSRPPGAVSMAVIGPMTNLALAMRLEPAIAGRLGTVVAMGGARSIGGNITASAEYNIFADPHAAQIVFGSGCKVVALGLDATHQVRITPERLEAAKAIETATGRAAHSLLAFACHAEGVSGVGVNSPLHDPCTIAWLLAPELFVTAPVDLQVETASPLTMGHTAVEFRLADPAAATVHWATKADADGVFDLIFERLAR